MSKAKNTLCWILGVVLFLFLFSWEMYRENNYLSKSYPTQVFDFQNYVNDYGVLQVQGNWYTTDLEGGTYTKPSLAYISCNIKEGICRESRIYEILDTWIVDQFKYNITSYAKNELKALRKTSSIKNELTFNLITKEIINNQTPLKAKTGNSLKDIGIHTSISKLVDSQFITKQNLKSLIRFWDTPIIKIISIFKSA